MNFEHLIVHTKRQVGWLEYNRPPINAINWEMLNEIMVAFQALLDDPEVRVIVFASALEKYFSVGADLEVFDGIEVEGMREWLTITHGLVHRLRTSMKPLLAAIHGTAVGGGVEVVMHCDQRFASTDARFGQPEININLVPAVGTTQSLVRLLGRPRAIRFLYDGGLVSAEEAHAMGMADILVEPGRLREEVQSYGEELATKPPEGLAAIRNTITAGMDLPFDQGLEIEFDAELELVQTENFREGVRAFLAKRKPNWK